MKINHYLYLILLIVAFVSCETEKEIANHREEINFGNDWVFQKGDTITANWKSITLPHTANIEPLVVNNQWQGISWYKKEFSLVKANKSQKHFIYFESIMQEADVWCNGQLVTSHKGGYLPFTADITQYIKINGVNEIIIKVDNNHNSKIPPGKELKVLDFNYYGGIYRNAHLITTNNIYITDAVHANKANGGGILIHFNEVSESSALGFLKSHVQNDSDEEKNIKTVITFSHKNEIKEVFTSDEVIIKPSSSISIEQELNIDSPKLWSPEIPNLYDVTVEVFSNENLLDSKSLKTGIRSILITEEGFFLNGKRRFINGTNRHQEYPYVGYAISDNAQYRDAYKIKQAGFDFVRLSHYPHSESFMNACDELGLMVMNCIPGWQYTEEGEFIENSYSDIRDMVRRDRNHPSVIIWENSLNESGMKEQYMIKANEILDEELPYDDTYSAGWIDHPSYDLFIPARQHSKAPLYWNDYDKGDRKILIAEYGDWEYYAQNAGFNQKEFKDLKEEERTSRQLRGDGEKRLLQQALNFQEAFNSNMKGKNTIGHANWVMFDYNRGYADDLESSGISDIFRIPKFTYYFYQSQKPPYQDDFTGPMVYIANYWQNNSSKQVKVYSNCEEVALYLNDHLIEKKKAEKNDFSDTLNFPPFNFSISKYEHGTLKAVAYINGKEVTQHSVTTPNKAEKLQLSYDISNKPIKSGSDDVVFVYAKIIDGNNTLVPNAQNEVNFETIGSDIEIIGSNPVKAEAGIATILLKINNATEPIAIKATAEGLESDILNILEE